MATRRINAIDPVVVGAYTVTMVMEVDEFDDLLTTFLIVDGRTIAQCPNPGEWEVLMPGWKVRDSEDGGIEIQAPSEDDPQSKAIH